MIEQSIRNAIRDVPDFPRPGIIFKDITPVLADPVLCAEINKALLKQLSHLEIDVVAGVESRGFLFGPALAQLLNVPFVPIRKAGKLPYKTVEQQYDLEYGQATIACHIDAVKPGQRVLIHDDLLATGGTVVAASELIGRLDCVVAGYSFLIALDFLKGRDRLEPYTKEIHTLVSF